MRCAFVVAIVASVLAAVAVLGWFAWYSARRPLFHEEYSSERFPNIFSTWTPTYPVTDDRGSIAFFDLYLNMIVVVLTEERGLTWTMSGIRASPSEAVLFADTSHQVHVTASSNELLIVRDNKQYCFPVDPGMADQWHRHLIGLTNQRGWNLLEEIAREYHGESRKTIEKLAQQHSDENEQR